ncbi:hypothetical protein BU23DRAFT_592632 [Bimuria novae-zelandiae CBS 107.79]|uniref:WSC domain-containing protein n=1 Tax=Bimuria novae-zelandiae CBS 107.79 TaxID=1447943 RepID=A0A6A5URF0_9PLEO|nr:hypothetical protein BU23DRAFT_592632 [Bimuria novae-zelandiae CBS 107.79]
MIPSTYYFANLSVLISVATAQDPFYMCIDNKCEDCPSSVASTGTGYPNCVIYNVDDVFGNQGYEPNESGGYSVFFDVQPHEPGCATIIKTPASTDLVGCGFAIGSFQQPTCAKLALKASFMVQTCCGEDCDKAGGKMIRGLGPVGSKRSISLDGRGGLLLKDANGNIIEPAVIGPPVDQSVHVGEKPAASRSILEKRSCTENSWQGGEVLTRPADEVQIMSDSVNGGTEGASVTVTTERSQSYTSSMSLGISDIISLGVSTEFTESYSTSEAKMGQCDGGEVEGEVCWPTEGPDGDVSGTYAVITES